LGKIDQQQILAMFKLQHLTRTGGLHVDIGYKEDDFWQGLNLGPPGQHDEHTIDRAVEIARSHHTDNVVPLAAASTKATKRQLAMAFVLWREVQAIPGKLERLLEAKRVPFTKQAHNSRLTAFVHALCPRPTDVTMEAHVSSVRYTVIRVEKIDSHFEGQIIGFEHTQDVFKVLDKLVVTDPNGLRPRKQRRYRMRPAEPNPRVIVRPTKPDDTTVNFNHWRNDRIVSRSISSSQPLFDLFGHPDSDRMMVMSRSGVCYLERDADGNPMFVTGGDVLPGEFDEIAARLEINALLPTVDCRDTE
jgi:hypothetical protein